MQLARSTDAADAAGAAGVTVAVVNRAVTSAVASAAARGVSSFRFLSTCSAGRGQGSSGCRSWMRNVLEVPGLIGAIMINDLVSPNDAARSGRRNVSICRDFAALYIFPRGYAQDDRV